MPLNDLLPKALKHFPDQEAVVCGDYRATYRIFAARTWQLARALNSMGMIPGDRVAILHENCHVYLEAYFAAAHLGLILVPLNYRLSSRELALIVNDCGARILIAQGIFDEKISGFKSDTPGIEKIIWTGNRKEDIESPGDLYYEEIIGGEDTCIPPEIPISRDDVAHLYYTSGTTGRSKGVMLTHGNVQSHALGTIAELTLTDKDRWFHVAPLFHLADAWATFAITWAGGKHVIIPGFDPDKVIKLMVKEGITITNLIPAMLNLMVNHPGVENHDYSSLRVLMSGGAPIAPGVVKKIIAVFRCDYIQTYGMTETSPYLTLSILKDHLKKLPWEEQLAFKASTGREFINVKLRVVDDNGRDVARDGKETGEIIVKGDTVTPGYWNLPGETAKALSGGWLRTGDLAVINSEEYVTIVDRKKDMIITGGENVYSTEVENILYSHPAVLEAAVIGIPDSRWGEAVKACVVLKKSMNAGEQELIDFCKKNIAHYKAPKSIDFLDALPRTGSGKIYKKGLRDPYLAQD